DAPIGLQLDLTTGEPRIVALPIEAAIDSGRRDFEHVLVRNQIFHVQHGADLIAYIAAIFVRYAVGFVDIDAQDGLPTVAGELAMYEFKTFGGDDTLDNLVNLRLDRLRHFNTSTSESENSCKKKWADKPTSKQAGHYKTRLNENQ